MKFSPLFGFESCPSMCSPNVSLTTNIRGAVKEIMDFPPSFSLPLFRKFHPDCPPTPMEMKLDIDKLFRMKHPVIVASNFKARILV